MYYFLQLLVCCRLISRETQFFFEIELNFFILLGKSNPYCEAYIGSQEHRTLVVPGSLNPKWNASMQFLIKDLKQDVLCLTVFNRDSFSPNGNFLMHRISVMTRVLKNSYRSQESLAVREGEGKIFLNVQGFVKQPKNVLKFLLSII